jgi:YHS domain-containing protein
MVGWVIKLLLLFVLLRAVSRLWHGIIQGMQAPRDQPPAAVPLARDPVCGTFVVPSRALTGGTGADLHYFCSENCRRTYEMKGARQASAGGPPQAAASAQRDGERKRGPIERSDR